jgi:hypothetical protein
MAIRRWQFLVCSASVRHVWAYAYQEAISFVPATLKDLVPSHRAPARLQRHPGGGAWRPACCVPRWRHVRDMPKNRICPRHSVRMAPASRMTVGHKHQCAKMQRASPLGDFLRAMQRSPTSWGGRPSICAARSRLTPYAPVLLPGEARGGGSMAIDVEMCGFEFLFRYSMNRREPLSPNAPDIEDHDQRVDHIQGNNQAPVTTEVRPGEGPRIRPPANADEA